MTNRIGLHEASVPTVAILNSIMPQSNNTHRVLQANYYRLGDALKDPQAKVPGRPLTTHYSSVQQKIHFMDTHGIQKSVVSLANPWLDFVDASVSLSIVKKINEEFSDLCGQ
ncbi:hypothetical protein V2G26_007385 [Clonostachys chloroleuca]